MVERSIPARAAAAAVDKRAVDSLMAINPNSKVVIMGDLNDDPISHSITKTLGAKGKMSDVKESGLFNPWADFYRRGIGTLAYQDSWITATQIIISQAWLGKEQKGYFSSRPISSINSFWYSRRANTRLCKKNTGWNDLQLWL